MFAAPLTLLRSSIDELAQRDPLDLPDSTVVSGLEELAELRTRIEAIETAWLAVADTRDATVSECGRAPRSWLIEELLVNPGEASRRLRLSRELPGFPAVQEAFRSGDLSREHVHVILAALRQVPSHFRDPVETALVELSRVKSPFLVARDVDQILAACGVDDGSDEAYARRYGQRGVTVAETFGGTGSLAGTLSTLLTDKLRRALDNAGPRMGLEDERTTAQRAHDGLETIVDHYLDTADQPDAGGERPARATVTIPLATLEDRLSKTWAWLDSGAPISPEVARRLACDAEIIPVVLGGRGEVLDIGQSRRAFSMAIRRAAKLRDGGRCVFPHCQRPPAELHHILHWARGGASSLDNAAWLCAFHHWLVHEGCWSMRRDADGTCTFTSPAGIERTSLRHTQAA